MRGSGVCEGPEAEAQLQAIRSLSEPKSSNHPQLHLVSLCQFFRAAAPLQRPQLGGSLHSDARLLAAQQRALLARFSEGGHCTQRITLLGRCKPACAVRSCFAESGRCPAQPRALDGCGGGNFGNGDTRNNTSVDAYMNALLCVPGLWRRAGGLTGDAEQQRRSGNSKRALGAHALRIRWSLLRELRANVMMKQHRCNGQIKSPSSCSLTRDCRANYIQYAVCHGAAGQHVAAVTCSA